MLSINPNSRIVETHRAEFESGISPMKIYIADHLSSFQPTLMTEELDILRKADP